MIKFNLKPSFIASAVLLLTFAASGTSAQPALGTTSFENTTGSVIQLQPVGVCTQGRSATSAGFTFYLRSAVNCAINNPTAGSTSDGHINLITTPATTGIWQEGRIASSDGSAFKLNTITLSALTIPFIGKTLTFTGYRENAPVSGATLLSSAITATGLDNQLTVDFTSNTNFDSIDEVRIIPSGTDAQGTLSIHSINISEADEPLPLFFTSVEAVESETGVLVRFKTVSESQMEDYEIQLSEDGTYFRTVDRLDAKNGATQQYTSSVVTNKTGNLWIRIKANQLGDAVNYSRIAMVNRKPTKDIVIYPNSAQDVVNILNATSPNYRIFDATGKIVQTGKLVNQQINISSLPAGLLFVQIDGESHKIVKQ